MPTNEERGYDNTCLTLREPNGRRIYKQCTNTTGHIQHDTGRIFSDFDDTITFRFPSTSHVWQNVKSIVIEVPDAGEIDHIRLYGSGDLIEEEGTV